MPQYYKRRILQHVGHKAYEPQRVRELADSLGVPKEDLPEFRQALDELTESNQVVIGSSETIALPPIGREVTGTFKLHERGFGFILPDEPTSHGDVFVPPGKNQGAMTGDRVRAEVSRDARGRGGRSGATGKITEIIQRGHTQVVGVLGKVGSTWVVTPDGKALADPVLVRDVGAKNAKEGQKVVVEFTRYPERGRQAEGVITEVLGERGEPDVETLGIMRAFGLPEQFPDAVVQEARDATRDYDEHTDEYMAGRMDLRETFTLTIDPPDARDFDDALTVSHDDDGWELGVHIADVATFVRPGSELDREATERGNSVYLPRKVIPMLPEVLSNGICSLQPGVPRLAKSVFIRYDHRGQVKGTRFASSVIASNYRLTYLEAQALIDGKPKEAKNQAVEANDYSDELTTVLGQMHDLSRLLRKRREEAGMISLDLPEVELVFDDEGHVVDAHPEDDAYTHQLIEVFMVEANEAVATAFNNLDVPVIRRIHPDPSAHDTDELRRFARVAGYNIPANPSRQELQGLLMATKGKPEAKAVHLAVLKTLTKAEYSPALIGHFALASEHYLHFTSPIRRYPDLTVHRALEALFDADEAHEELKIPKPLKARQKLARKVLDDERAPDEQRLQEIGRRCSNTERNAEGAERELRALLVLQLMEKHVGDEFAGTVTGVTNFGIFVQIDKYLVEGLIKTERLPGAPQEQWRLNEHTGAMTAQRSGRAINIGDTFTVLIDKVDLTRREMDLHIVEESRPSKFTRKGQPRAEQPKKQRKKPGRRVKTPRKRS